MSKKNAILKVGNLYQVIFGTHIKATNRLVMLFGQYNLKVFINRRTQMIEGMEGTQSAIKAFWIGNRAPKKFIEDLEKQF